MPKSIEERHPSIGQAMRGLWYSHLAEGPLREFSGRICDLVVELVGEIEHDDPAVTILINKAVEFKDAAVRAKVFDMVASGQPKPVNVTNPDGSLRSG